jgi:hypothetical protein
MAPTSSGSARSERGTSTSGDPRAPQNRNPSGLSCPHVKHPPMPAVYEQPDPGLEVADLRWS